ncbi:hypothetical protein [Ureaplasma diversum]|uniref:Uncharacterized protein n=1 Tax=Ureaplasma diversum NCTC 246 TaxID=1188241 RepID=A0A084EVQ8_9BACT|nr:hypothetical protein [Ureaplasma diversum]KEZ22050.1 hypothetical protein UDIV_7090 [Ureaplasma diversum NCTC 246]
MQKLNHHLKLESIGGAAKAKSMGLWGGMILGSLFGDSVSSIFNLAAQIVYMNNPNPLYSKRDLLDNPAPKIYTRLNRYPTTSSFNVGSPFF